MFNIDTILSSFDCKGTLLKWLKKIVTLLENESLTDVQIKAIADGKAQMILTFEDGSIKASNIFDLPQGPTGAQGPKGDTGDGFNNLASMVIATANGLVSADDGFHVDVVTQFKAANGDLIASATGSYTIPIEGSQTVVCDIDEANHKINIHLDAAYKNKIDRALQLPTTAPTATQLVAVGTNNAQTMLGIGDGLLLENGQLKAKSGTKYMNFLYMGVSEDVNLHNVKLEANKVYTFFNVDTRNYQELDTNSFDWLSYMKTMKYIGGDSLPLLTFSGYSMYQVNALFTDPLDSQEALYISCMATENGSSLIDEKMSSFDKELFIDFTNPAFTYYFQSVEVK